MDPALARLLFLRLRGGLRYRFAELRTLRGIVYVLVVAAVIGLLLWRPAPFGESMLPEAMQRGQLVDIMSLGLLGACLLTVLTASGPALYFSPAEIALLFAGPFSRPGLLLYKVCFYAAGALLSGLIIALIAAPVAGSVASAFVGSFMMLLFIQLLSASIGLAVQKVSHRGLNRPRWRVGFFVLIAGVALGLWFLARAAGGFMEAAGAIHASAVGTILMAPFRVFAEAFLAGPALSDLAVWTALAVLVNGVLLVVLIRLDAHTDEASVAACEESEHRWARAKRGGFLRRLHGGATRSFRAPTTPGGLAPVTWRQALNVLRSSTRTVGAFVLLMLVAGPLLAGAGATVSPWSRMALVFFVCVFVLPRTLVFDFRSDLVNMENLKALPLAPWRVCAGQVLVPVLLTSAIELVLIASALPFLEGTPRTVAAVLAVFVLPFNLLMYGLENAFYLMFPKPLIPIGRVDFDFFGRTLVDLTVKTFFLTCACAAAVGLGLLALQATGRDWLAFGTVAWLSLGLIAVATLPLMAWAYRRYDVGREAHVS